MPYETKIHGRSVPSADYETLRSLERIAYGLTPTNLSTRIAHAIALTTATEALAAMRVSVNRQLRARSTRARVIG